MVRAIDTQHVILQSSVAEKVQQIQQQNSDMQQRHFAMQLSEQDHLLKEKIKQSEQTEKSIIKEKEEHESGRKKKEPPAKDNTALLTESEKSEISEEGGHINITV